MYLSKDEIQIRSIKKQIKYLFIVFGYKLRSSYRSSQSIGAFRTIFLFFL